MDLSSVVDVHIDNVDMNEDEADQDDLETAAVNEQLNQIEAELAPIIKTLVQMKTSFDQMEGMFGVLSPHSPFLCLCVRFFNFIVIVFVLLVSDQKDVIDKNTQLLCWESDLLLQEIKRD